MRQTRGALLVVAVLGAVIVPSTAPGEENRAAARLEAMATFLAKAQRLSVTIDCAYDVVQDSGEKIEFGERRVVALRRPDHARIDVTRRDGSRRGLLFDGTQLAVFDLDEKVYATVSKPGTVDAAFDYFVNDLNMRLPLREILKTDFPRELKDVLGSARLVGEEQLGGAATDHPAPEAHRHHLSPGRGAAAVRGRSRGVEPRSRPARHALHLHTGGGRGADPHPGPTSGEEAVTGAPRGAAVWVTALVIAVAGDVAARGGGRGGGGRGGYSRGGAAAAGSFGQGRATSGTQRGGYYGTQGPAASGTFAGRSSGGNRQDTRHEGMEQRREQYQQNAQQRQQQRNDAREDWQNYGTNRREDWQDYADDHYDDHYDGGEYPYGAAVVAGAAVGAAVGTAVATPPYWTLDCIPNTVVVGGTTYYQCGSAWYVRAYSGGDVAYTMVNPPTGY
ncbi:MAG: DUF2092 domain-containing protein [Deltaproteobacteria bacterium]|nr:MAG: DUF2092 domain-containing protein [Deltaproteobacteria bacterium]